ncbi:MAG: 30S ribosomal protein S4 [Geminicoccaceae bacterium]|nr:MAG: 30S ribosomal protein S4 [Geminicoccaceae bacterium]
MTKRVEAKSKICRRLGVNLWGRAKDPLAKKNYAPGMHGQKRKKVSDYGQQLMAKQRLKGYYANMTEKQFRRAYETASKGKGDTAENLIGLLERRLDVVVFRMNVVQTMYQARQFVNHGHVLVNGRRVSIPSYSVREGDVVEVAERSRDKLMVAEALQNQERDIPEYIEMDMKGLKARFVRTPKLGDVPFPVQMEPNMVIEYYSR